jgi:preprotein translocase SecE subunit
VDIYKIGEGKMTRRVAFYSLLILSVWGFKELASTLAQFAWARTTLLDFTLPYYGQALTVGVLLSIVLNVVFAWFVFRYLNGQKPATLLIDTETELKKVSWPTWEDARHSTIIVLIFVAVCAAYLTAVEYALANIFRMII